MNKSYGNYYLYSQHNFHFKGDLNSGYDKPDLTIRWAAAAASICSHCPELPVKLVPQILSAP